MNGRAKEIMIASETRQATQKRRSKADNEREGAAAAIVRMCVNRRARAVQGQRWHRPQAGSTLRPKRALLFSALPTSPGRVHPSDRLGRRLTVAGGPGRLEAGALAM